MRPDEKLAALYQQRDVLAYAVVGAARVVLKHGEITDELKQALAEYDAAHKAALAYENSKEYKIFLAAHRTVPLRNE
jgi:hypothetical protein